VEFEESLYLKSIVYGTKDGSKGLKFEPKCFDLAVIALDVDELVLESTVWTSAGCFRRPPRVARRRMTAVGPRASSLPGRRRVEP
jgi:hypothetical protein